MRLLVIEDEHRMAELLQRGLSEDGYFVDVENDGAGGILRASRVDYDAIILDVMLADQSGFSVCSALRSAEVRSPILMLTARTDLSDRVRGLDAGADDYLTKPFHFAELVARLRALVRRDDRHRHDEIVVGSLRLDRSEHRAYRDEVELNLSPTEFSLLEFFMRHPNVTLTRSQILHANWDAVFSRDSNVVDQYVSYLRRKIDYPFHHRDLETIRGVGYRLVGPH